MAEIFARAPGSDPVAEALAAYVPPFVLACIARDAARLLGPRVAESEGAVLFTDISGFTRLTERLEARGPAGVEELSRHLNAYFTVLIGIIEEHGGLVAKFAGDALMAVWPAGGDAAAEPVRRAARCGFHMQEALGKFRIDGDAALSIKVSIGAGALHHALFGGVGGRWVSMLAGEAMEGARAAMRFCESGEVTIPAASARMLDAALEPRRDGIVRLCSVNVGGPDRVARMRTPLPPVDAMLAHVPHSVRDRITAGHTGWLAEFRRVTALFIHVPEVDLGRPDGIDRAQAVLCAIQREVERFRGAIGDTGEDHAGLVVLSFFGLPHCTHEDDAARAVRAALAIHRDLAVQGLRVTSGISTGRLFCGSIGSPGVRSYSMVGDAMNCAARLMQIASGEVLCDEATRTAAGRHLQFDFLHASELRGKEGTVAVYRPIEGRAAVGGPSQALIGRATERGQLRERLAGLRESGCGGAVIVQGEAGIGKTTLAVHLRAEARAAELRVLEGGADFIDAATSYRAWQPVFTSALGIAPEMEPAARAAVLLAALNAEDAARLAPLLNPVVGTELAENEITSQMTAQSRAEAATEMLVRLLQNIADGEPLVVVIEDCHWLDSASLALALAVLRGVPALLLVLLTRPPAGPGADSWSAFCEAAGADRIDLGPLERDETIALACRQLGAERLDESVARFIVERSGGNPFFSEELCNALRDGGHIIVEDGCCRLAPESRDANGLNVPTTVQGVVSARIDRLDGRERLAMKVASVNGREFSLRMLRSVHPVENDHPHLRASVERMVALGFAVPLGDPAGEVFEFRHAIVREVAYEQLVFSQRRKLHRRLAEWMELDEPANMPLLAHHWTEAGVPAKAIPCLGRAGDEASRRFANREAAEFLGRAIALAISSGENVAPLAMGRWHRQLGEAQFHLGRINRSRENLCAATRILGWPMPEPRLLKRVALPREIARQAAGRLRLWRARSIAAERRELLVEALNAYGLLGELAFFTNDMPAAVFCLFHGANLAEKLGASPKLAELFSGMTIVTGALSPLIGGHYMRLTERILDQFDAPVARGYADQMLGIYLGGLGSAGESRRLLEEGAAIFRQYGNGRRLEESLLSIIYPRIHRGEYEHCAAPLDEMRRSAERRGDTQTLGWVRILRTQLLLALRGPQAALDAMGGDFATGVDTLTCTALHASAAVAHWRLGDGARAWQHAEAALVRCESRLPVAYVMLLYTSYVAEVFLGLLEKGDANPAEQRALCGLARRACAEMRRFARAFPVGRPRASVWNGLWHWIRGRKLTARRHWRRALAEASDFGMLPDIELAHRHLARCDGDAHRAEADAIRAQLGEGL